MASGVGDDEGECPGKAGVRTTSVRAGRPGPRAPSSALFWLPRDAGPQFPTPETVRERAAVLRSEPKVATLTNRMFWVSVTITASPG